MKKCSLCLSKPTQPDPMSTMSATYHDVEDDAQAPDIGTLRYVRNSHQNLGRGVRVATTVGLAAVKLSVHRVHIGTREAEIYYLDVVLKRSIKPLQLILGKG